MYFTVSMRRKTGLRVSASFWALWSSCLEIQPAPLAFFTWSHGECAKPCAFSLASRLAPCHRAFQVVLKLHKHLFTEDHEVHLLLRKPGMRVHQLREVQSLCFPSQAHTAIKKLIQIDLLPIVAVQQPEKGPDLSLTDLFYEKWWNSMACFILLWWERTWTSGIIDAQLERLEVSLHLGILSAYSSIWMRILVNLSQHVRRVSSMRSSSSTKVMKPRPKCKALLLGWAASLVQIQHVEELPELSSMLWLC